MVKNLIQIQGTGKKSRSNAAYSVIKTNNKQLSKNNQLTILKRQIPINNSFQVVQKPRKVKGGVKGNQLIVTVSHAEYLSDIVTSADYKGGYISYILQMNPGLKGVFPWCSKMASSFEAFNLLKCTLCYKPSTSTITKGVVFIAALYDVSARAPEGKSDMLETQGCVEATPFTTLKFSLAKGNSGMNTHKSYKLRNGSENIDINDLKLYDCANIHFSYQGISESNVFANLTIGELWIDYTVQFMMPVANTSKIQIDNIETISGFGSTGMSVPRFLGTNVRQRLFGKFASAGLSLIETAGGYLWSSAKTIAKTILTDVVGTIGAPLAPLLELFNFVPGSTEDDDGQSGLIYHDDDSKEHMQLLVDGSPKMVLNTNLPLNLDGEVNDSFIRLVATEYNPVTFRRIASYQLKMKPGQVLRMQGSGIEVPISGDFQMTDLYLSPNIITNTIISINI